MPQHGNRVTRQRSGQSDPWHPEEPPFHSRRARAACSLLRPACNPGASGAGSICLRSSSRTSPPPLEGLGREADRGRGEGFAERSGLAPRYMSMRDRFADQKRSRSIVPELGQALWRRTKSDCKSHRRAAPGAHPVCQAVGKTPAKRLHHPHSLAAIGEQVDEPLKGQVREELDLPT